MKNKANNPAMVPIEILYIKKYFVICIYTDSAIYIFNLGHIMLVTNLMK